MLANLDGCIPVVWKRFEYKYPEMCCHLRQQGSSRWTCHNRQIFARTLLATNIHTKYTLVYLILEQI